MMGFSEITSLMLHILVVLMIKVLLIIANIKLLLYGHVSWASLVAQLVKNLPAMQETWIRSLGWEDQSLGWKRAWQLIPVLLPGESPRTEEPGGLQFMGLQTVGHDWATKHSTKAIIAWEILWMEKPGWLQSMGSQRVRQNLVTEHAHTRAHQVRNSKWFKVFFWSPQNFLFHTNQILLSH